MRGLIYWTFSKLNVAQCLILKYGLQMDIFISNDKTGQKIIRIHNFEFSELLLPITHLFL